MAPPSAGGCRGATSRCPRTLPVAAEVDRGSQPHRQLDDAVRLLAVADAARIFPPGRFLSVAEEIGPGDVVMVADLAAAQAGEEGLCAVGAGTVQAVALLMVDPPSSEPGP